MSNQAMEIPTKKQVNKNEEIAKEAVKKAIKETRTVANKGDATPVQVNEKKAVQENVKKPPFYVATGRSITCKKGILTENQEVKQDYLREGKESLDRLVEIGRVIKA